MGGPINWVGWSIWESPNPANSTSLRLLYNPCRVAPGKTQVGADLGQHQLGNLRACTPSGHLQTMSEHHYSVPAQLILHRWHRLVVSGHSQSLQLTDVGKSLPLICEHQPKLTYKRRVYSTHKKGAPRVHSLYDRRGCVTGTL